MFAPLFCTKIHHSFDMFLSRKTEHWRACLKVPVWLACLKMLSVLEYGRLVAPLLRCTTSKKWTSSVGMCCAVPPSSKLVSTSHLKNSSSLLQNHTWIYRTKTFFQPSHVLSLFFGTKKHICFSMKVCFRPDPCAPLWGLQKRCSPITCLVRSGDVTFWIWMVFFWLSENNRGPRYVCSDFLKPFEALDMSGLLWGVSTLSEKSLGRCISRLT
jgi:hypothetical protein